MRKERETNEREDEKTRCFKDEENKRAKTERYEQKRSGKAAPCK